MDEDDLREFELALDRHGALSGEDSGRLVAEVRRLRAALRALVDAPWQQRPGQAPALLIVTNERVRGAAVAALGDAAEALHPER